MALPDLLKNNGLTSAAIIDDAYDTVPSPTDITEDAWATFIADQGAQTEALDRIYAGYSKIDSRVLRQTEQFITAVWENREKLEGSLASDLFADFVHTQEADRRFLDQLEAGLSDLGIKPIPMGRKSTADAKKADIIFADLFLGAAQQPGDMDRSVALVKELIAGREEAPPPVVLMSRSGLLNEKKAQFRDDAKLLGALFRFYRKDELLEAGNLHRALERLATHHEDAIRMATFLKRYEDSLGGAVERLFRSVRKLDLADYGQVREILLNFEGQPLGSYLLDVFDGVMQFEIEEHNATVAAVKELQKVDLGQYPAPHIAGSSDLQELMYRTIWHHPNRLAVATNDLTPPLAFGDLLVRRNLADKDATYRDALLVITPACDLVREGGTKRVLLLPGDVTALTHSAWRYKGGLVTPIVRLDNGDAQTISWEAEDLRSETREEIGKLIADDGPYKLTQRMRENYALELQQSLLAKLGRVGVPAKMPATFAVEISVSYFDENHQLKELDLPILRSDGGICYVGRDDKSNPNERLVLTEPAIDELMVAIAAIDLAKVSNKARSAMKALQGAPSFSAKLEHGLQLEGDEKKYRPMKVALPKEDGATEDVIVGWCGRNAKEEPPPNAGGIIVKITHPYHADGLLATDPTAG